MDDFYYRKLKVYHLSKQLVVDVYDLIDYFPSNERMALANQLQRAVVSVPSNIAEGMGRFSTKERVHFIEIREIARMLLGLKKNFEDKTS